MSAARLLFLHLPKTAGVSLRAYFDRHFRPDRVIEHRDGAGGDFPASPALITGHLYGGWLDRAPADVITATLLREPVARVISQYRYWRGLTGGPETTAATRHAIALTRAHGLAELLRMDDPWLRGSFENLQTQMLGLDRPRGHDEPLADAATLRAALERLRRITCVGVTEQSVDFALHVAARCGWPAEREMPRLNGSPGEDIAVDAALHHEIRARNALDIALHAEAARLCATARRDLAPAAIDAAARRNLAAEPIAPSRVVVIAGPFAGTGWSERQSIGGHDWRWTIGAGSTVMTGPMPARAGTITLSQAPGLAKHEVVEPGLTLNGVALAMSVGADGETLQAAVPAGLFAERDANVITMAAARPRAMAEFLSNGGPDPVGLAVVAITLAVD